ncbi:MAG: DUF4136 domain-containing protein [Chitinophagaceae bacterium]
MKNKMKIGSFITAIVFLLAGCSSATHIEKDDTVNLKDFKTFAWVEATNPSHKDKPISLEEQQIRNAVNKELTSDMGWKEVKHRPDVLLSYDVLVEKSFDESTNPVYSRPFTRLFYNPRSNRFFRVIYPSQFVGYETDRRPVKEGTITLTMIDAQTNKTVWQGWTTGEVNSKNLTAKEIQRTVRSIFRKADLASN